MPLDSPGTAVPSHGVRAYRPAFAVDLLQPSPGAADAIGWSMGTRGPESHRTLGAPALAGVSFRLRSRGETLTRNDT